MKYTIFLLIITLTLLSCSKNDSTSNTTSSLNSTENTVKGKWFLKSKSDSTYVNGSLTASTSTYTSFQGTPYIELLATKSNTSALGGTNAKDAKDAGTNLGDVNLGAPISVTANGYWYYDETAKMFNWGGINLLPVIATSNELVLKFKYGNNSQVGYNITWKYQR